MASQALQGWHPNPQLMQPQHAPPNGWTGSWPPGGNVAFPPGYPGPPPMPGGAAHASWNAGYWQYNPLANVQNVQQPWAPGAGWFPGHINPYKRIPKPPSPSYWNTKLSDNGLGLEGMIKRKEPSEYNGEEPQTPWIWNPPSLLESAERATPTRDFNVRRSGSTDNTLFNAPTPTRDHVQSSSRGSFDASGAQSHGQSQTPDKRSALRTGYLYANQENSSPVAPSGPTRHGTDPTDTRPVLHARALGHTDSWPSRTRSHPQFGPAANEVPPYPAPTPTINGRSASSASLSAATQQAVFTQEPESFTSKGELQPTFSSNIIRTPTHYQLQRRSTEELPPRYHSRSPNSTPSRPEPLTRQASLPNPPSSASSAARGDVYTNFTEDLSNSLNTSSSSSRSRSAQGSLSRSRTEPVVTSLSTIHESGSALSSTEIFLAPLRDSSGPSSTGSSPDPSPHWRERERDRSGRADRGDKRTSPYSSSGQSPEPSPLYRDRRMSPYAGLHAGSHSHSHSNSFSQSQLHSRSHSNSQSPSPSPHTRTRDHSARRDPSISHNPLPAPPMERANLDASRPPIQEPSPPRYTRKVRIGFWNKRGDHLTPSLFVVYAPHGRAYPDELRDYPDEREGYRDQFGTAVPWREERPELPASLPCRGRPPAQPYDSFVVYQYLP